MAWVSTGQLAKALSVSNSAVLVWKRAGKITPELTTPGGHHRWDVEVVRAQMNELRKDDSET